MGNGPVSSVFADVNEALSDQWEQDLVDVERIADEQPLSGEMRARLRTLRYSIEAFTLGGPRINAALDLLLESRTPAGTRQLITLTERFETAAERADPSPGTAAEEAWQAFATDEAAGRTEATLATAVDIGLGVQPAWEDLQLGLVVAGLADGQQWGLRLTEIVGASARDLSEAASRHADAAGDRVARETALAVGLIALSVLVGLLTARTLAGPSRDLQAAARRVESGDFETDPVPVRGPTEVRETVVAFNDMTATLAAIEDHAVALAEDPDSPVLDDPLPGRTGQALQQAIDQLRRSVHEAESHRAELFELATHDGLTGLLNRAAAFTAIQHDLSRARRDGTQLLAFYVDLDGLKSLNDTYGHDVGDDAIARTADTLRNTTRDSDVVARLGGDEFMVVGPVPEGGPTRSPRSPSASGPPWASSRSGSGRATPSPSAAASASPSRVPRPRPPRTWCAPPTRRCTRPSTAATTGWSSSSPERPLRPARRPTPAAAGPGRGAGSAPAPPSRCAPAPPARRVGA